MALAYIDYESTITYDEYNMVFVKPVLACTVFRSMVISAMWFIFRTNPSPSIRNACLPTQNIGLQNVTCFESFQKNVYLSEDDSTDEVEHEISGVPSLPVSCQISELLKVGEDDLILPVGGCNSTRSSKER